MASRDQRQSYKAGEARGQAQEVRGQAQDTTGQMPGPMEDRAREGGRDRAYYDTNPRDKAYEVKEKTESATYQIKDKAAEKMEEAKQKAEEAARKAKETAQYGKEKTSGILQQTGEQVKHMAQGAADAVKSTFGMGKNDEEQDRDAGIYYKREDNQDVNTRRSY